MVVVRVVSGDGVGLAGIETMEVVVALDFFSPHCYMLDS